MSGETEDNYETPQSGQIRNGFLSIMEHSVNRRVATLGTLLPSNVNTQFYFKNSKCVRIATPHG
jgi:hypothetical protein